MLYLPSPKSSRIKFERTAIVRRKNNKKKMFNEQPTLRFVLVLRFIAWMRDGNKIGSLMKNMGELRPSRSQLPSSL
jgi:hypothetical protein